MAIEIVDFPIKNSGFSIAMLNYQRVAIQFPLRFWPAAQGTSSDFQRSDPGIVHGRIACFCFAVLRKRMENHRKTIGKLGFKWIQGRTPVVDSKKRWGYHSTNRVTH